MATAGVINVIVRAITKPFDDGINGVHKQLRGLTKGFADINGAVAVAQKAFSAVSGAISTLTDEISRLDEIGDTAERLNITADSLVKLQRAAQLTGGEVEGVAKSLAILQRTLGDAAMGNAGPVKALDKLGLSAKELIKLNLSDAFQKIVERISKLPTPAERASLAADLFGKSASNLTGLLTQGSSAIQEATKDIESFGAVLDETRLKSIDEAQKSMERLSMSWQSVKTEIALGAAPALSAGGEHVARGLAGLRKSPELGWFDVLVATLGGPLGTLSVGNRAGGQNAAIPGPVIPPQPPGTPPQALKVPTFDSFIRSWLRPRESQGPTAPGGLANPFGALAGLRGLVGGQFGSEARTISQRGPVGALEFGSSAAFSAVQASQRQDEQAKLQKQEIEETKKTNKILERGFENALVLATLDLQG